MVTYLQETFDVFERRACSVLDQNRQTQRYQPKRPDIDWPIIDRINVLSEQYPRYGYRIIAALLRREGYQINIKRVHRLWKNEGLQKTSSKSWRKSSGSTENACHLNPAKHPNDVWSYDLYPSVYCSVCSMGGLCYCGFIVRVRGRPVGCGCCL